MKFILEEIGNSRLAKNLLTRFDVRRPVNDWLSKHPITRQSKSGRSRWLIDDLSAYWVAQEIFHRGEYDAAISAAPTRTFIDLGANAGYFTCRLAEFHAAGDLKGLCLEANPKLLPKIERNLRLNGISGACVINGLAGVLEAEGRSSGESANFHASDANSCSSVSGVLRPGMSEKTGWNTVTVPCHHVFQLWKEKFPGEPIDLLKVDIEGCEENLVANEPGLFLAASRVVMETHHWLVNKERILAKMAEYGFAPPKVLFQSEWWNLFYWERQGT